MKIDNVCLKLSTIPSIYYSLHSFYSVFYFILLMIIVITNPQETILLTFYYILRILTAFDLHLTTFYLYFPHFTCIFQHFTYISPYFTCILPYFTCISPHCTCISLPFTHGPSLPPPRRKAPQVHSVRQGLLAVLQPHHPQPEAHGLQALLLRPVWQGFPEEGGPPAA